MEQGPTLNYAKPPSAKRPRHISIWFLLAGLLLIPGFFVKLHIGTATGNSALILLAVGLMIVVPGLVIAACVLFLTGR